MDKATKVAVEKYPHGKFDGELGDSLRAACAIGYMQAEKDLALTWEDASAIVEIAMDIIGEGKIHGEQNIYTDVLKRFNDQRKK